MRPLLLFLLTLFLISSCDDAQKRKPQVGENTRLLGISYQNYKEIPYLKNYEKVSDTSFIAKGSKGIFESTHRITELKENEHTLILFSKIALDNERHEIRSILDTLRINDLDKKLHITIGYCESENILMEQTIAIVEKTKNDTIQKIISIWKANPGLSYKLCK